MSNTFEENGIALLARHDDLDMGVSAEVALFTIPDGVQCIITKVIFKPAAAGFTTLAAHSDFNLGKVGATADWFDAADPHFVVDADGCLVLDAGDVSPQPVYDAAEVFQIDNTIDQSTAGSLVDVLIYGTLMVA